MLTDKLKDYKILLGSKSPRRQQFLKDLGLNFTSVSIDVEEDYPKYLHGNEITSFLAKLKADAYENALKDNEILITADTIVRGFGKVLGKPKDIDDAKKMLLFLSERQHEVITSICLKTNKKTKIISDTTTVHFKKLTEKEIDFYIANYQPFDKAGAYGIQEWLGYIAVEKIEGSFYTVMGFPVHKFYKEMMEFSG
ncbi:Maf family nucleotide pyrophosphatase [Aureibaculum sp. 2210JD6-5]|uniref:Maf family nucleotide pyrophosphatase n=1 Tax=Aureibaculum sp. 2210JD6-5 TaxID=3103957 RepID=UPI002AAD3B84|nr:Maf family nucleotide pyrophosphatase [Aureibaculum sp. 2210JD6-5]MDY7395089.1 Maf family nucleotide pyrophosphatase [Aureibaculum sp. 2210JD6-5]